MKKGQRCKMGIKKAGILLFTVICLLIGAMAEYKPLVLPGVDKKALA